MGSSPPPLCFFVLANRSAHTAITSCLNKFHQQLRSPLPFKPRQPDTLSSPWFTNRTETWHHLSIAKPNMQRELFRQLVRTRVAAPAVAKPADWSVPAMNTFATGAITDFPLV